MGFKLMLSVLVAVTGLFLGGFVFAQVEGNCTVNGQPIPCDQFWSQFGWIIILVGIIGLLSVIFWVWMLIDCIKRDFKDKTPWILVILFGTVIGSILYFFLVKRKMGSTKK